MEERLVDFKTSKLAKEKDFNENCHYHYSYGNGDKSEPINGQVYVGGFIDKFGSNRKYKNSELANWELPYGEFSAPTQSFLQKWFRDIHNIDILVQSRLGSWIFFIYDLNNWNRECLLNIDWYQSNEDFDKMGIPSILKSYEEALEIGLEQAFKLI